MSEKPFWEGKTCEEMANLHVKVTFVAGAVLTGITDCSGHIRRSRNSSVVPISANRRAERFVPYRDIESIELVDDPEYERIEGIYRIDTGDVVVCRSGNKYPVVGSTTHELRIEVENYGTVFISREDALFGLRPKPKLPDHDGLWLDKNGKTWVVSESGTTLFDPESLIWRIPKISGVAFGTKSDTAIDLAPFRPAKAVEA